MKKYKTTKKEVIKNESVIVQLGYKELHNLLKHYQPTLYTSGVNGWNCDIYLINGVAISTGYRPFGIRPSRGMATWYAHRASKVKTEEEAKQIMKEFTDTYKKASNYL